MLGVDPDFGKSFDSMQAYAYRIAKMKGFHDKPRDPIAALGLVVTEVAEAIEAVRKDPNAPSEHIGDDGYSQLEEELADIIIRVLDFAEECGAKGDPQTSEERLDIVGAIFAKIAFNAKRERMHGKKA